MFHLSTAWESVNFETFDQLEHDTRISYHGTAASKAYLQAPPPLPLSQTTARLAALPDFFGAPFLKCGAQCQAKNPWFWNAEYSFKKFVIPSTIEIRFQVTLTKNLQFSTRNPESMGRNPESKTLLDYLTWGESDAHAYAIMMRPN